MYISDGTTVSMGVHIGWNYSEYVVNIGWNYSEYVFKYQVELQ